MPPGYFILDLSALFLLITTGLLLYVVWLVLELGVHHYRKFEKLLLRIIFVTVTAKLNMIICYTVLLWTQGSNTVVWRWLPFRLLNYVSHHYRQESSSGLHSPRQSNYAITWLYVIDQVWVQVTLLIYVISTPGSNYSDQTRCI